jgi:hypothetical protein
VTFVAMARKVSRAFDLASLFDRTRFVDRLAPYSTYAAELDAVASGKKGISRIGWSLRNIADYGKDFAKLLEMAFDRRLVVLLEEYRKHPAPHREPRVYILRLDQIWRVPALNALWDTAFVSGSWSFSSEAQESLLLGYTPSQRKAWMAAMRHERPAQGCNVVFTLMTADQRDRVVDLGRRCFGEPSMVDGMKFFFHRDYVAMQKNAFRLVPAGLTLARVGLEWKTSEALFGPWKALKRHGVVTAVASKKLVPRINESLRSNIEFLTRSGWK